MLSTKKGADFTRSGGGDFQSFVLSDFFEAGFFHLLLIGLLAGLVFGALGAAFGKWITLRGRVRMHPF